ncbi:MAG: hypothetical protein KC621_12160 [Myxococcales bacterium]|nr:hypothetical protein [Myxococcales bacterium]
MEASCDLASSSVTPTAITQEPGGFAITDATTDTVTRFDRSCHVLSSFSTGGFGALSVTGIAYDPTTSGYALLNDQGDELYYVTTGGVVTGQCDLAAPGVTGGQGIAYDAVAGVFAVVDSTADRVFTVDRSVTNGGPCNVLGSFDTSAFGATNPSDIAWVSATDELAILDSTADEVFVVDKTGVLQDRFDTGNGFGATTPTGLVYDVLSSRYQVVDSQVRQQFTVDVRGSASLACATSSWSSLSPQGLTVHPSTGDWIVVDNGNDRVSIVDPLTCTETRQIDLAAMGATDGTGVAYLPLTNELVVTHQAGHELFFLDYDTGTLGSRCAVDEQGIVSPTGVAYLPDLDLLAVSSTVSGWLLLDAGCNVQHARSTRMLHIGPGSTAAPRDIAYHAGQGTFLVLDDNADEVYVSSFEGTPERRFDTAGLGLTSVMGVAATGVPGRVLVLDSGLDEIHAFDLPALTEALSLSGRFVSPSTTLYLWERGDGRVTGTALVGANTLPVFGQFDGGVGNLAIGAVTPLGAPVSFSIAVSADLDTISAPPPVGTLTRQY